MKRTINITELLAIPCTTCCCETPQLEPNRAAYLIVEEENEKIIEVVETLCQTHKTQRDLQS